MKKFMDYATRVERMSLLISRKATGSREEFASKIGISPSSLFNYLTLIEMLGRKVAYDHFERTYYFTDNKNLRFVCGYLNEKDRYLQKEQSYDSTKKIRCKKQA